MYGTLEHRSARRVACVIDLDNLLARRGKFGKYARAHLDVCEFKTAVKERGITQGVVFQNQPLSAFEAKIWGCLGLEVVSTRTNVDNTVKLQAINFALEGIDELIVCASDGGYCDVIKAIRDCGILVEVWCLRESVSLELMFAADRLAWMDGLVAEPRPADRKPATHRANPDIVTGAAALAA
jgi:hypothetical protein